MIALRQLGDVLLMTPVLHSLRLAYPLAKIDVLVYDSTAAMLAGNPDIDALITTSQRPKFEEVTRLVLRLWRRYDLAISTQTGDRPIMYAYLAAKLRIGPVPPNTDKGLWKRKLLQRWVEFDDENTHTVLQNLKLLTLIGIPQHTRLIPPQITYSGPLIERWPFLSANNAYVVLHPHPMWAYKRWTVAAWQAVARRIVQQGDLQLVVSGGGALTELEYVRQVVTDIPEAINLAGQLSLAELSYVLAKAQLFIGPDTGITHLAAAAGVPTIALFGPTNPVKWAPWPHNYGLKTNPFVKLGTQQVNNITLIQGQSDKNCVPCHQEGCDRHQFSQSACLTTLAPETVIAYIDRLFPLPPDDTDESVAEEIA